MLVVWCEEVWIPMPAQTPTTGPTIAAVYASGAYRNDQCTILNCNGNHVIPKRRPTGTGEGGSFTPLSIETWYLSFYRLTLLHPHNPIATTENLGGW